MPGQMVGTRVSSTSQNLARQLEALGGVDELFTDHQSGKGTAARSGDSGRAASSTAVVMMVSNSMGVNRPSQSCRRRQ